MAKDIKGKPKLRLIPRAAMEAAAKIREYGIEKYGGDNYHDVPCIEFIDAALRHLYKHLDDIENDDESGLPHLHHALTSLILAVAVENNNPTDDIAELNAELNKCKVKLDEHTKRWQH